MKTVLIGLVATMFLGCADDDNEAREQRNNVTIEDLENGYQPQPQDMCEDCCSPWVSTPWCGEGSDGSGEGGGDTPKECHWEYWDKKPTYVCSWN